MVEERLTRDLEHGMIGGVLAGMARYWDLDVTLLRIIAVVLFFPTGGLIVPLYLAAWLIIPRPDQVGPGAPVERPRPLRERFDRERLSGAAREASDTARRASDRMSEATRLAQDAARAAADAARAAADAARTAAEELTDIAHPPARPGEREQPPAAEPPPPPAEPPPAAAPPPPPAVEREEPTAEEPREQGTA